MQYLHLHMVGAGTSHMISCLKQNPNYDVLGLAGVRENIEQIHNYCASIVWRDL